ncbi:hypothetical protein MMC25_005328 [Agyrium rufum]|nr:hypothetical protein [Agyrium rufum]
MDPPSLETHDQADQVAPETQTNKPSIPASPYSKPCTICHRPRDVLVRCRIDESQQWHFVCPGRCWKSVSGGEIDGVPETPFYQYGGMWKNKHDAVSARKKKKKTKSSIKQDDTAYNGADSVGIERSKIAPAPLKVREWVADEEKDYTVNDKVEWRGGVWICRRSHASGQKKRPDLAYRYWKEDDKIRAEVGSSVDDVGDNRSSITTKHNSYQDETHDEA